MMTPASYRESKDTYLRAFGVVMIDHPSVPEAQTFARLHSNGTVLPLVSEVSDVIEEYVELLRTHACQQIEVDSYYLARMHSAERWRQAGILTWELRVNWLQCEAIYCNSLQLLNRTVRRINELRDVLAGLLKTR